MNISTKVRAEHTERGAYLYVRQSTMKQVIENTESTKRQYALRGRAIALGWQEEQITVIDDDLGESGASASWREGFQRLVADVTMGRAGIVMGIEVSRLARNNADWHRLLEICALSETLILDEDGVYDPSGFNDRLLLGLKGTMSEAELHVIKARLRGGILSKARRGEYRCPLPTGFVYDHAGRVVLDPDIQVRESLTHFFETFVRVGSACQTVKVYRNERLSFPSRLHHSEEACVFRPLTTSAALRTLKNPRYAGAYVYGRRRYRRIADGTKKIQSLHDRQEWTAYIPDAHPGYISLERYEQNLKLLKDNGHGFEIARTSPPREGAALLQGRVICGRCGRTMRTRYADRRGRQQGWYVCDGVRQPGDVMSCQSISAWPVDAALGALITQEMTPAAVALALEIRKEIEARYEDADRMHIRAIERAQIEADLAQRRFMFVDPSNRLVADTLEGEWNEKLQALARAREERERSHAANRQILDESVQQRLIAMTTDFGKLWNDPGTAHRERKRLLAHLIEDVTLVRYPDEDITRIHILFKGGKTETLTAKNARKSHQQIQTPRSIIDLIDQLLDDYIYEEIAEKLNAMGLHPGASARPGKAYLTFTTVIVRYLRIRYKLRSRYDRLRERGLLTKQEVASRLGIHEHTVVRWAQCGLIKRQAYNGHFSLYEIPATPLPSKHSSRWDTLASRANAVESLEH